MTVSDMWKAEKREWDPVIFEGILSPEEQQLAATLYLSKHATQDSHEWAYSSDARYSVKSGYWVATHVDVHAEDAIIPPNGSMELKRNIWKLKLAPKIQHFLWRCLSGALATSTQLQTRMIPADPICQRCCYEEETINHILFTCPFAQAVWQILGLHLGRSNQNNLETNIELLLNVYNNRSIPMTWRIWKPRNDFLFRKINRQPDVEVSKGFQEVTEWLEANYREDETGANTPSQQQQPTTRCSNRNSQWTPPPVGWIKCNFDSGFVQGRTYTTTAWILRDCTGKVILSDSARLPASQSALQAEAYGFLHALQQVWIHGYRQVWFEGDNLELTNLINTGKDHLQLGTLLIDIRYWMSKLPEASLDHTNRAKNSAADSLSHFANSIDSLYNTFTISPSWLVKYLYHPYTIK